MRLGLLYVGLIMSDCSHTCLPLPPPLFLPGKSGLGNTTMAFKSLALANRLAISSPHTLALLCMSVRSRLKSQTFKLSWTRWEPEAWLRLPVQPSHQRPHPSHDHRQHRHPPPLHLHPSLGRSGMFS